MTYFFHKFFIFTLFIGITASVFFNSCQVIYCESSQLLQLREKIEKQIDTDSGIIGISYIDLTSGEYLSINGDHLFNPASVIKVPVMVEAFRQREMGLLNFSQRVTLRSSDKLWGSGSLYFARVGSTYTVRELIETMITHSDNTATKMLIRLLGMKNITGTMRNIGLKHTVLNTSMLLKAEGLNYTTPNDMATLMYQLYQLKVVSPQASLDMIGIMLRQQCRWGIPRFLPDTLKIANKTGSLNGVRNDTAIIFYKDKPYILSILTNQMKSNTYAKYLVSKISQYVYEWKATT